MTTRWAAARSCWRQIAIRLPDDGTDALPLLRNVILNDSKSSTYKLGLLRVLCRIADGAFGLAEEQGQDHVSIPMGLVALTWIRLYKPLIEADIPQSPVNDRGGHKLGFVTHAGVEQLDVSHHDLRVGTRFFGDRSCRTCTGPCLMSRPRLSGCRSAT